MDKSINSILEKQAESSIKIETLIEDSYYQQTEHLDALNKIESSISDTYLLQVEQLDKLTNIEKLAEVIAFGSTSYTSEEKLETTKRQERGNSLLEEIAKNIGLLKEKDTAIDKKPEEGNFGLVGILAGIAAALGIFASFIGSFIKNIEFFMKLLTPNLYAKLTKGIEGIIESFTTLGTKFRSIFDKGIKFIGKVLLNEFELLKETFSFGKESNVGKIIKGFKTAITTFLEPFIDAIKVIKDFVSGPVGGVFKGITKTLGFIGKGFLEFGAMIGRVGSLVGKLFLPLQIIMTVWDTVKGAMEGFEKDGIIGGIAGAVKGFINSLILGPLDMLKDVASWVAEKFGFDNVSKMLDSFSFEAIFNNIIDNVGVGVQAVADGFMSVIETILTPGRLIDLLKDGLSWVSDKLGFENISEALDSFSFEDIFSGMVDSIKSAMTAVGDWFSTVANSFMETISKIGIPEFEVLGVKMGPWYPFANIAPETPSEAPKTEGTKVEPGKVQPSKTEGTKVEPDIQHSAEKLATPELQSMPTSDISANAVYQKSAENVDKKEDMATKGGGNTVVSAPTVNTSNKTVNQQSIKLPTRNPDSTSSRYVSSRYAVQ